MAPHDTTMAPHSTDKSPIAMSGTQKETLPSTTGTGAGTGGGTGVGTGMTKGETGTGGGVIDKVKAAMGGAPWQVDSMQTFFSDAVHSSP